MWRMNKALVIGRLSLALLVAGGGVAYCGEAQAPMSPRNAERRVRPRTDYIVLHTTEARESSALRKITANGEANYFIGRKGKVYPIIDKKREAYHAGRSMWNGRTNVDAFSIGIEISGYCNADITAAQYDALRELLSQLQARYKIPDERVMTHSMVAYGAPNKWHKSNHRGRKRCGMLFATDSVRSKLGLTRKMKEDPDVKSGRLKVGDAYLARVLYGSSREQSEAVARYTAKDSNIISKNRSAWEISGDDYNSAGVLYVYPDGRTFRGDKIRDWSRIPVGTKVISKP